MKIRSIFTFMMVIVLFLIFIPQISYATDYSVKPVILIPNDWKYRVTQDEIAQYKAGILNNLNSIQQFYTQVFGKTFNYDRGVDIVYSTQDIKGATLSEQYKALNSPEIIRMEAGKIKAIWVVGGQAIARMYAYSDGPELNSEAGKAVMPYEDLLTASGRGNQSQQQFAKYALAHELGHAFGATWSDYSDGHPCTEVSKDHCKANPAKYPSALEWTSIMGYGTDFLSFPKSFFNNTITNPEMQAICRNPFINCQSVPPPTESKTSGQVSITGFFPNTIIAGQTFEIRGSGFDRLNYFRLENMSERKNIVSTDDKLKILEKSDGRVVLQTPGDLRAPDTESEWIVFALGPGVDLSQFNFGGSIIIKGKQLHSAVLENHVKITCGQEKKPMPDITVSLSPSNKDLTLASSTTDIDGSASLIYIIQDAAGSTEYYLITDDGSVMAKIAIPNPPSDFVVTTNFNFPQCPGGASASPSPFPVALAAGSGLSGWGAGIAGTDQGAINSQSQATSVQISNYSDFRSDNSQGDLGSPTIPIEDPASHKIDQRSGDSWDELCKRMECVDWHLNTLSPDSDKKVYLRVIEGDNYTDHIYLMSDGEIEQVPFDNPVMAIRAQVDNKIIKVTATVNGQDTNIDPELGTQVHLNGDPNKDKDFDIPYEFEDAKDGILRSAYKIAYRTTKSCECTFPQVCTTVDGKEGIQTCNGVREVSGNPDSKCVWDQSGGCNPGCSASTCVANDATPEPSATVTPSPSSNYCTDAGYKECSVGEPTGDSCTNPQGQTCTAYRKYACNFGGKSYCDENNPSCGDPCTTPPPASNYCVDAGYVACNVGQVSGSCSLDGKTCTAYNKYVCNFGGQNYCDNNDPTCGEPCQDASCQYHKDGENNCMYSDSGKCYVGHIDDMSSCHWVAGGNVCFNPDTGCDYYICGSVSCPYY